MAEIQFEIKSFTPTSWRVIITLPKKEVSDEQLLEIFRAAKRKISTDFNLPIELLQYKDIDRSELHSSVNRISVMMEKVTLHRGEPAVQLKPFKLDEINEIKDMILELDLFPQNTAGAAPIIADIEKLCQDLKITPEFIDKIAIGQALNNVKSTGEPLMHFVIGKGRMPGKSADGKLEYCCQIKSLGPKGYIGVERVENGNTICKRTPSVKTEELGMTLLGKSVPPKPPKDYTFSAGENTKLTVDACTVLACHTGTFRVKDTSSDQLPYITWLTFSVENLTEIDGSKPVNLILEKPVEIKGGLKTGSTVVSEFEVIISGNVEAGANIQTASNIVVNGDIVGAVINGKDSIDVENVSGSRLIAEGKLMVKGTASNTYISGKEVYINKLADCTVSARDKLVVEEIQFTGKNSFAKLKIGAENQLKDVVKENRKFLDFADNNLKSLIKIFGEQIIAEIEPANLPQMLLKHMKNIRLAGGKTITPEQKQALTNLLQVIPTLKSLASEKRYSIKSAENKMKDAGGAAEIFFKNAAQGSIEIDFGGIIKKLESLKALTKFSLADGKVTESNITGDETAVFDYV